uniref:Uncharacterized protein n=1 Tax=Cyclopterus lumpus TaxID=8103 RepID=A0A8C2Z348_CYCLU
MTGVALGSALSPVHTGVQTWLCSSEGPFDPVLIAHKLRTVADALNDDVTFKALEAAFSQGVEAFCQTQVSQKAEVVSEMQLIRASVALGLYVKKTSPELKHTIQSVMTTFLTRRVGPWVTLQGGWVRRLYVFGPWWRTTIYNGTGHLIRF